ncbi:MAG: hypothetical protein KF709_13810 [Gemmatimonadaceae bacterium]|nr:hypothetical protein [Gemmatimonadaceae bacterium]
MDVVIHSHHASVSEHMRKRALRAVQRVATRLPRAVEAILRFEEDGPTKRVTVTLRAPRHHDLMGRADGKFFGPALVAALARVTTQINREKRGAGHASKRTAARARVRG